MRLHDFIMGVNNVAVFVTRRYGGTHLGPKRFTIVKELIKSVLKQL